MNTDVEMIDGIDHVMIAVRDLAEATRRYRQLGFAVVAPGGRHIGRGTENTIIRLGWGFVELIAVHDAAERAQLGLADDGITKVLSASDGGFVDAIILTHAIDRVGARLSAAGLPIHEIAIERARPDGITTKNRILAPSRGSVRNLSLSFIQWQVADPERLAPQAQAAHPNGAQEIVGLSFIVNSMTEARAYAEALGLGLGSEEFVADLAANRARCQAGTLQIDFLAARGKGLVRSELTRLGEGLFEAHIRVRDLAQCRARLVEEGVPPSPAPGVPGGWLLPVTSTVGARMVLVS